MLYRRGAFLARAVDLEHDRTARDDPAIASWRSSSPPRLLGPWHNSDTVTRRRAIAFTRQNSGQWQPRDRAACSPPVSTQSSETTFRRQCSRRRVTSGVVEAIVSSDPCPPFNEATPITDRGLLNHAWTSHLGVDC
jgi:hypothetical protein